MLSAKEIADDVQQTFENVSNEYRNILEKRIIEYGNSLIENLKTGIETRKAKFVSDVSLFRIDYEDKTLYDFCMYWTEHNPTGKKMRFEKETVFDISKRLTTWKKNEKIFNGYRNNKESAITGIENWNGK